MNEGFEVVDFLKDIGLSSYHDKLSKYPMEELVEFTDDDLKEIGVLPSHRKKLLAALGEPSAINTQIDSLPQMIALPLHEYLHESHPSQKLWAACDVVELLLRFLVTISTADRRKQGELDDKLLRQIWGKIEMPTLAAWFSMACSLAEARFEGDLIAPEIDPYVSGPLKSLLYGPESPGTPETSFLKLRNHLAHSGGMTKRKAEQLLAIWQKPFEQTIEELSWLSGLRVIGLDEDGTALELKGVADHSLPATGITRSLLGGDSDGVWVVRDDIVLPLWPMALFGRPSASNASGGIKTGDDNATQIYVRKDIVRLQFTPLGADSFSHSEADETALEAFQKLFSLDRAKQQASSKSFKQQDFTQEIQKDAYQMVGRIEEQSRINNCIDSLEQGLVWLTGNAGMGKSFLMARIANDLMDKHKGSHTIVLPYRFKAGDDSRCSRGAFVDYVIERLVAADALIPKAGIQKEGKAEERLKSCLGFLSRDRKVIFVLDGLDEIHAADSLFTEEIPLALAYPGVTWVCAGRPEAELMKSFRIHQAIMPYPEGLPPMRTKDIRGMLLEKIGPLRKKLLANDKEKDDEISNPFIDLVAKRAAGFPLYVKYVIGDVLSNRYRVLDGDEDLPDNLHAYHERLIEGFGIGDLRAVLTPLAATLAVAHEPLAEHEIVTLLTLRDIVSDGDSGTELIRSGLSALTSMLRRMPDPEGEEGFTLFHKSLRDHMLTTSTMADSIKLAQRAFAQAAMKPDDAPAITNYLYRAGVDHLIEADMLDEARARLLDLDHLQIMYKLGKTNLKILQYWNRIGDESPGDEYTAAVNSYAKQQIRERGLEIVRDICSFCRFSGWYKAGVNIAEISIELHEKILGSDSPQTLKNIDDLGSLLKDSGNLDAAEEIYRRVLKIREDKIGPECPATLICANNLGLLLSKQGKINEAETLIRRTLEAQERNLGPEHLDTLKGVSDLGAVLWRKGEMDESEIHFRRVLEARERILSPEHPDTLKSVKNLGVVLWDKGEKDEGESLVRRAIEGQQKNLGPEHPDTLKSIIFLGKGLWQNGEKDEPAALVRRALEIQERKLGPEHPDTLKSVHVLAEGLWQNGEKDEAETLIRRAIDAQERMLGPEHLDTLDSINNLAVVLSRKGHKHEAEALVQRVFDAQQKVLDPKHPEMLASKQNLATYLRDGGKPEKGITLLKEVLEIRRSQAEGRTDPNLASVLTALGTTFGALNQFDDAISHLTESAEMQRQLISGSYEGLRGKLKTTLARLASVYESAGNQENAELIRSEIDAL
jgi:tetratricopeptide (TPR) repeat protein